MKFLMSVIGLFLSLIVQADGKLLIAGGAIASHNEDLYQAFIAAQPSTESKVCIVPVASSSPVKSANAFKQDLIRYGMDESRICIFPLAVVDDKSTEFDETKWRNNAYDESLFSDMKLAKGFWFTGGDQMRIVESLTKEKADSPLLKLLKEKLKNGAVIGGSSAGAAMMSEPMIAAGDSFSALTQPQSEKYYGMETQEKGQLYLHQGLGFFPYGLVDQHFDRKARLGRLIRALSLTGIKQGYAVDENTAMLVDLSKHMITAVGEGNVTIVDLNEAKHVDSPFEIQDVMLSVLAPGDSWNIKAHEILTKASPTRGHEYFEEAPSQGAGLALANIRLSQLLGFELMDNKHSQEVRRYSFIENAQGVLYRFKKKKKSQGFWQTNGTLDQYSVAQVYMDIEPVKVTFSH